MDSGFITALFGGIAAVIGALAVLLRQQRVNSRAVERDRARDRERIRVLQRMIETLASIAHELRVSLAGQELPARVARYEELLEGLRQRLEQLDAEDPYSMPAQPPAKEPSP